MPHAPRAQSDHHVWPTCAYVGPQGNGIYSKMVAAIHRVGSASHRSPCWLAPRPAPPSACLCSSAGVAAPAAGAAPTLMPASLERERIEADGSLTTTTVRLRPPGVPPATSQQEQQRQQAVERPPGLPAAAPSAAPLSPQQLEALVDLLQTHRRVVVLTGAGASTGGWPAADWMGSSWPSR